jgi:hypothetical protein
MQNIVGGWTQSISSTLLNEMRLGYNHTFSRRFRRPACPRCRNSASGCRSIPLPSISEINANNFFNIGDNLEASFYRPGLGVQRSRGVDRRQAQPAVRRRVAALQRRNPDSSAAPVTSCSPLGPTTGTGNTLADFLLGQLSQFDQGDRRVRTVVNYGSLFVQDDFRVTPRLTLNLGARLESPPWHEKVGGSRCSRSPPIEQRPLDGVSGGARGETFRGDAGTPEDGTDRR